MAYTTLSKKTWWNTLRVEHNIRVEDLGAILNKSIGTVGAYLSGEAMPKDSDIKKLCDFFDIEFSIGKQHFKEDHALWESTGHTAKRTMKSGNKEAYTRKTGGRRKVATEVKVSEVKVEEKTRRNTTDFDLLQFVYGKLSYKDFMELVSRMRGAEDVSTTEN